MAQLAPGDVFAGRYTVEKLLSRGGMGAVYEVAHHETKRHRALKLMHPMLSQDSGFKARFSQEARVGANIHSAHIVEVIDAGVDEVSGTPFLVMELLDGADLSEVVARRGALSRSAVRVIFQQLRHAIAAAHAADIVHRDLKPENIYLARSRRADVPFTLKVLDFGIAKVMAEAATKATAAIGTPLWMAPEQTDSAGGICPGTDIWALGLIAFFLLTGRSYWRAANSDEASNVAMLREIVLDPLAPASQRALALGVPEPLPEGFDAWFGGCVERDLDQRSAEVGEAIDALCALLDDGESAGDLSQLLAVKVSAAGAGVAATVVGVPADVDGAAAGETVLQGPAGAAGTVLQGPVVEADGTQIASDGGLAEVTKGRRKKRKRRKSKGAGQLTPPPAKKRLADSRLKAWLMPGMMAALTLIALFLWLRGGEETGGEADAAATSSAAAAANDASGVRQLAATTLVGKAHAGTISYPELMQLTRQCELNLADHCIAALKQAAPKFIRQLMEKLYNGSITETELKQLSKLCAMVRDTVCSEQAEQALRLKESFPIKPTPSPVPVAQPRTPGRRGADAIPTGTSIYDSLRYDRKNNGKPAAQPTPVPAGEPAGKGLYDTLKYD